MSGFIYAYFSSVHQVDSEYIWLAESTVDSFGVAELDTKSVTEEEKDRLSASNSIKLHLPLLKSFLQPVFVPQHNG